MIASVSGTVQHKEFDAVVINVGGLGYRVYATPHTLGELRTGAEATLVTSFIVREDDMSLFGFSDQAHKDLFELVRSVSGIGARLAMAIVGSFTDVQEFATAVRAENHSALVRVPGIGKRTAQRLVVELKDKVGNIEGAIPLVARGDGAIDSASPVVADVVEALIGLGFAEREASDAAMSAAKNAPNTAMSVVLRHALNTLGKNR